MSNKDTGRDLAFDISRQFLTLALGGLAFAIGITGSHPASFHSKLFWGAITCFGASLVAGFAFLMHAVSEFASDNDFDVYDSAPRILSAVQVLLVAAGAVLLLWLHAGNLQETPAAQPASSTTTIIQDCPVHGCGRQPPTNHTAGPAHRPIPLKTDCGRLPPKKSPMPPIKQQADRGGSTS